MRESEVGGVTFDGVTDSCGGDWAWHNISQSEMLCCFECYATVAEIDSTYWDRVCDGFERALGRALRLDHTIIKSFIGFHDDQF